MILFAKAVTRVLRELIDRDGRMPTSLKYSLIRELDEALDRLEKS